MPEIISLLTDRVWANLRPADLLDIALVATALYFAFVWIRQRVSRAVGFGLGAVILAYVTAQLLDLYLTTMTFRVGLTFFLFGLILVFQDDIRRLFERLRAFQFGGGRGEDHDSWGYLDEIVAAVEQMAEETTGALIVMEGAEAIEVHTHGGRQLDGEVSRPLLRSIFDPDTDGHDGAVIVDNGRIERFGVHLPLATDGDKLGAGGTRHAAALGLSERSDAMIIVVSEETGRVSVAREGTLRTVHSPDELDAQLADFFDIRDAPDPTPRWKRWLTRNL
ncbi:MAG: diadenylate cyclase, partial [Bradymonadaceae bacterium]